MRLNAGCKMGCQHKGKCFNCGKPSHFSKDCNKKPGKLKNKFNMLNIDDKDQKELFKILEPNNSSDSLEDEFSPSFSSCYQSADDSSDSPNIKIGCRDSCCNVISSIDTLTKSEENEKLIIQLINQIQNPVLQKEYLDKFKKNLLKDETSKKLKSTISFEETLERFNKKKSKDLTVNDLQYEITIVKKEMIDLKNEFKNIKNDNHNIKQELIMLKIDKNLDHQQINDEQDEHKDGDKSSQQSLLSEKGIVDHFQLSPVHKLISPKWFTKVRIIVSPDYHFTVIAVIDSGTDMNCIQE